MTSRQKTQSIMYLFTLTDNFKSVREKIQALEQLREILDIESELLEKQRDSMMYVGKNGTIYDPLSPTGLLSEVFNHFKPEKGEL